MSPASALMLSRVLTAKAAGTATSIANVNPAVAMATVRQVLNASSRKNSAS